MTPEETLAEVRKALHNPSHAIVLESSGWFIRHPLACRHVGGNCYVTKALMLTSRSAHWLPQANGTYPVDIEFNGPEDSDTEIKIGNQVVSGYDPMMDRLIELGVW